VRERSATPSHRRARRRRTFSDGCIRVWDPVAPAEFLLRRKADPEWWRDASGAAMLRSCRADTASIAMSAGYPAGTDASF
jgi:murein L,D-transpeptidase YcbB/YkuD